MALLCLGEGLTTSQGYPLFVLDDRSLVLNGNIPKVPVMNPSTYNCFSPRLSRGLEALG